MTIPLVPWSPSDPFSISGTEQTDSPVFQRAPEAQQALASKWSGVLQPLADKFGTQNIYPLFQLDVDRVNRDQMPLSSDETVTALHGVLQRQTTPAPEPSFLQNVVSDVTAIATNAIKLPWHLATEEIPALFSPAAYEKAQNIFQAPGVRLLPGAFIGNAILSHNLQSLEEHPVMTALDVLPYANKVAEFAGLEGGVTGAAEQAARPAVNALSLRLTGRPFVSLGEAGANLPVAPPEGLVKAIGRVDAPEPPTLLDAGTRAIWQNQVKQAALLDNVSRDPAITDDVWNASRVVRRAAQTPWSAEAQAFMAPWMERFGFGRQQRSVARFAAQEQRALVSEGEAARQQIEDVWSSVVPDDRPTLTQVGLRNLPSEIDQLPPEHQEILAKTRAISQQFEDTAIERGLMFRLDPKTGRDVSFADEDKTTLSGPEAGEVYTKADATPILSARNRLDQAQVAVTDAQGRLNTLLAAKPAETSFEWNRAVREATDELTVSGAEQRLANSNLSKLLKTTAPERFNPMLQDLAQQRAAAAVASAPPGAMSLDEAMQLVKDRDYGRIPGLDMDKIRVDVNSNWVRLQAQGFDPIWHPIVSSQNVQNINNPAILTDSVREPSQIRGATNNASPSIRDFSIALKHQALEWLTRDHTDHFIDTIKSTYGKTRAELQDYFGKIAADTRSSAVPFKIARDDLINKEWSQFAEREMFPWRQGNREVEDPTDVFLPKPVTKLMRALYPADKTAIRGLYDATGRAFRVSVLTLSPRYYLHTGLGGAMALLGQTGPEALTMIPKAWKMFREGELPNEIPRGLLGVPQDVAASSVLGGKFGARIAQEAHEGTTFKETASNLAHAPGAALGKIQDWTYKYHNMLDGMYRSIAYLYGEKKGGPEYGIQLASKVLADWDTMLPVERSIVRGILPFYGWMRHISKYVLSYPFDHPVRAALFSNFARNEIQDHYTGLPQTLQNMMVLGPPDKYGNVKTMSYSGSNPFSDAGNYFTLAGFVSALNPVIGGVLDAMGVSPISGKADLYQDTTYNPRTGRLEARGQPLPERVLGSVFPQYDALTSLLGVGSPQLKQLRAQDPEAYWSRITSGFGMVPFPRTRNFAEERAKAELSRSTAMQNDLNYALKTNDWTRALREYPNLRFIHDRVLELQQSGQLNQFAPPQLTFGG